LSIFQHLTNDDFNTVCDALDVLSEGADLFYVLSHPNDYSELVIRLAEFLDDWDCYRLTGG